MNLDGLRMARGFKTGGRVKGSVNKVKAEIKELAQQYGEEALHRIVELMRSDEPKVAFSAAQEIMNRAYGKPTQHIEADVTEKRFVMEMPPMAASADEWLKQYGARSQGPSSH